MADDQPITFTPTPPETMLPPADPEMAGLIDEAMAKPPELQKAALAAAAARWPESSFVWASLAELVDDPIEQYAYARTGYHRGLDALRAAGWRGSGLVRWRNPGNRGFLRSLDALRSAAGAIGESEEEHRCALFLRQLDPDWQLKS
jgi:hypothetical protein